MKNDKKEGNTVNECQNEHYPYPAQNIFLVTGAPFHNGKYKYLQSKPMIVVSQKETVAKDYYSALSPSKDWKAYSIASLAALLKMEKKMVKAQASEKMEDISHSSLFNLGAKKQPWSIRRIDDQGEIETLLLVARSMEEIEEWNEGTSHQLISVLPFDALQETIAAMKKTQVGEDPDENYAMDYAGAEDLKEAWEAMEKATPEEVRVDHERAQKYLKNMSPERKKRLEMAW